MCRLRRQIRSPMAAYLADLFPVGSLVGAAMVVLMALGSVELWIIIVSSLVLLGVTLVLISFVAE